jgi:hypothetical protein
MVGILVHGNNHFILNGPRPDEQEALGLVRHFSLIQIGPPTALAYEKWQIREKEFRENLQWALIIPGDRQASSALLDLLSELAGRGIVIDTLGRPF